MSGEKNEIEQFMDFRRLIFSGPLYILKNEYIHILYKLYIRIIKSYFKRKFDETTKKTTTDKIFSFRNDFIQNKRYSQEIAYLENIMKGNYDYDLLITQDEEFKKILESNYKIVLSKYGYEVLVTYIELCNLSFIQSTILGVERVKIIVSDNLLTENYVGGSYITDDGTVTHLDKINSSNYICGMLRENYNYLIKLEEIAFKKVNPAEKGFDIELEHKYPIEKSSTNFLSNSPDYKNKYLIDLAKNYINRHKIGAMSPPNILQIEIIDPNNKITCVEYNKAFKVVLLGKESGKIVSYNLTEDSNKDYKQEYRKENQQLISGEKPQNLLTQEILTPNLELPTSKITYIGHTSAITSLSLNYDSFYFVSSSCDGTIRLWCIRSGTCLAVFKAHVKSILNVVLAPKGYYFASGGADSLLFLWSTNKATPLKKFVGHSAEISCLKFSKNMIYLFSASYDKSVVVWSIDDGIEVRKFFTEFVVVALEINEVGEILITGDTEGHINIWNVDRAYKINSIDCSHPSYGNNSIRGIDLAFDESVITIFSQNKIAFYDFRLIKDEKSRDVFERIHSDKEKNKEQKILPFKLYESTNYDIRQAIFNWRNTCVIVMKN